MNIYHMAHVPSFMGSPMVMLYFDGCNFSCRGCLRMRGDKNIYAEDAERARLDLDPIVKRVEELAPHKIYLEGYEPTMDEDLPSIVERLSVTGADITLMTNGSLLTESLLRRLDDAGLGQMIVGVKALDDERHVWYTGQSNRPVLDAIRTMASMDLGIRLQVETILLPGVNGPDGVMALAEHVASIDPSISFFIEPYIPHEDDEFRETTKDELIDAVAGSMRHLHIVTYHPLFSEMSEMRSRGNPARSVDVDLG